MTNDSLILRSKNKIDYNILCGIDNKVQAESGCAGLESDVDDKNHKILCNQIWKSTKNLSKQRVSENR
jgi:hypothetical protein